MPERCVVTRVLRFACERSCPIPTVLARRLDDIGGGAMIVRRDVERGRMHSWQLLGIAGLAAAVPAVAIAAPSVIRPGAAAVSSSHGASHGVAQSAAAGPAGAPAPR